MKYILFLICLFMSALCPVAVRGQEGVVSRTPVDSTYMANIERMIDSVERVQQAQVAVRDFEKGLMRDEMKLHAEEMLPLLRGGVQYFTNKRFNERDGRFRDHGHSTGDYLPAFSPLAVTYALEIAGVKGRSKWQRLVTANAFAFALNTGLSWGAKHTFREWRPNMTDRESFPSGHSAVAFLSASILEREYGYLSPWVGVGGYAVATGTSLLRLRHDAHYVNDVFMGAGIGIVSAQLGYFLADRIFGGDGIRAPRAGMDDVRRFARFLQQPTSLALVSGSNWTNKRIGGSGFRVLDAGFAGTVRLRTASTFYSGVEYSHYITSSWAAEARLLTAVTQVKADVSSTSLHSADVMGQHLNQWELLASVKYSLPVSLERRASFRVSVGDCFTERADFRYDTQSASVAVAVASACGSSVFVRVPQSHRLQLGCGIGVDVLSRRKYVAGLQLDYSHVFSPIFPNRLGVSTMWRILL